MKSQKVCPNEYEHQYWPLDKVIVGIDEAGRGPLAGPLTVAGVIFPIGYENPDIYDSKSISERNEIRIWADQEDALWFEIIQVTPEEIDKHNIYRADQLAMEQIAIHSNAEVVLTDAMPLLIEGKEIISLVKGDQNPSLSQPQVFLRKSQETVQCWNTIKNIQSMDLLNTKATQPNNIWKPYEPMESPRFIARVLDQLGKNTWR